MRVRVICKEHCRYWGLTNQRQCLVNGMLLSMHKNWTFVLPWWRVNYDPSNNDPQRTTIEPLSFVFDEQPLREFANAKR